MLNLRGVVGTKGGRGVGFEKKNYPYTMDMYQVERCGRHRPTQISYRVRTRVFRPSFFDLNCRDVCGAQPREFKMFQNEITEILKGFWLI
jgi:hypothetical protein